jgi:hypothetical protein
MKGIKYILSGVGIKGRIKGRIKVGPVLIVIRSVLDIAYRITENRYGGVITLLG